MYNPLPAAAVFFTRRFTSVAAWPFSPVAHLCIALPALLLACLLPSGCTDPLETYQPQYGDQPRETATKRNYLLGVHPLHNPVRLFEVYGPLVDLLNARIPNANFTLEASYNYAEFDKKLYGGHFDLALPNPYQTINALAHGYQVFGKMADNESFRGIILVRKDSGIRTIADLKGKAVGFPAATALAATMMPQQYLHDHGLPMTAYESRYVGSQESAIMNVYLGITAAGATWPPPWLAFQKNHPDQAAQLAVQWQTEPLPNNGLVARDDFPPELLGQVSDIVFNLQNSAEGKAILARIPLSHFESATAKTYGPVRLFIAHFDKTVRRLKE